MTIQFDTYGFRARALPVFITLAPAALLAVAFAPDGLQLPFGGFVTIILGPLSFMLSQIGADFGKQLEKRLWTAWGGPPTTRFLRNGNAEFNAVTRNRVHEELRKLGLHVPARAEEEHDNTKADKYFESCTEELIRRTRDRARFPLVFKALVEYGFRRNLLGLKPFGVTLTSATLAVAAWSAYTNWSIEHIPIVPAATAFIGMVLLLMWIAWVTPSTVKLSAERYARFILEAALSQE